MCAKMIYPKSEYEKQKSLLDNQQPGGECQAFKKKKLPIS